jgi:hypothetical protein
VTCGYPCLPQVPFECEIQFPASFIEFPLRRGARRGVGRGPRRGAGRRPRRVIGIRPACTTGPTRGARRRPGCTTGPTRGAPFAGRFRRGAWRRPWRETLLRLVGPQSGSLGHVAGLKGWQI